MCNKFSGIVAGAATCATALLLTGPVHADSIALTLIDNGITISGEFVGFKDEAYIVMTTAGELNVPAIYVTCEGTDCLDITAQAGALAG